MAFNSDPQNFEQYVRQSVEHVHRVPSDEVWEQLAERLDAWEGATDPPISPAKTSGKLKVIVWPGISMIAAAAAWALLMISGSKSVDIATPAKDSQSAPLVLHTTPDQSEQPNGQMTDTALASAFDASSTQHISTPTANHSSQKPVANLSAQVHSAHLQANTDITEIRLSFSDSNSNAAKNIAYGRLERLPLPNPWSQSLSFNYPKHTAPAFLAETQREQLLVEEDPKRKKFNINLPRFSLKSLRKGNDWDYQIGLVASSFSVKIPDFGELPEPPIFKQALKEMGVQAEWVLSERFRIASGIKSSWYRGEYNPTTTPDTVINALFLTQTGISMDDVSQVNALINSQFVPHLSLQAKMILNPRARKIRYFMGLGTLWRFWFMGHRKSIVRLHDESLQTYVASQSAPHISRLDLVRLLGGVEWSFAPAVTGQISGFTDLYPAALRNRAIRQIRPLVGVEGAIYVTGNRGYFRKMR